MCLFIIGPRVNSLKGVTAHHSTESVTAVPGAPGVKASGMVMQRLLGAWDFPGRPGEAQRGKGFSEAQQGNELGFKAGAREKNGCSGSGKGLRA